MKGRPIDQLVYEQMFPKPRSQDPQNFHALLQRHLILEVRQEVHSFYGHLDTPEAKYPGLDYNNRTHRARLSRWQWHRRLFRAFDALRLTPNEISGLTKWEGTKWAKERYEREQNCTIRDTAMDGMPVWNGGPISQRSVSTNTAPTVAQDHDMDHADEEDSESELESVGVALNERLRERVAARNAGDLSVPLDEDWEQWFKNAVETGEITALRERQRMMDNARAGNFHEIPEALQDMIWDAVRAEDRETRLRVHPASRAIFRAAEAAAPTSSSGPLASSQIGILASPLPSVPHATHPSSSRTSFTGLRMPGSLQEIDGGTSSPVQRTNA